MEDSPTTASDRTEFEGKEPPLEQVEQDLSEKEFCQMYTSYYGEEIDNIKQLVSARFTGEELLEFIQHCFLTRRSSTLNKEKL